MYKSVSLLLVAICAVPSEAKDSSSPYMRSPPMMTNEERKNAKPVMEPIGFKAPPNGGKLECSAADCTATAIPTPGFSWTDELRAAAKPVILPSRNLTSPAAKSSECSSPVKVTDFGSLPQEAIARIVFKGSNGNSYICSGAFIADETHVLTAGHCCYDVPSGNKNGGWGSDWEVTVNYGTSDAKRFTTYTATVNNAWKTGDYAHDYCFLTMSSGPGSYLGWWSGYDPKDLEEFDGYGYAENYGDNEELYEAIGTYNSHTGDSASGVILMDCNPMHHGNSGGPWCMDSHVIGVNSYHDGGDAATQEHSPYFGTDWYTSCQYAGSCKKSVRFGTAFIGLGKSIGSNEVIV